MNEKEIILEIVGHIILFVFAAGSQGLGRSASFAIFSISVVVGIYFLGWLSIVTALVGMFAGIKGLSDQQVK